MNNNISVITICFNNLEELKKTCVSVDAQTEHPYEHFIINGSTKSDIKEWLELTPQPAYRKWINEKDNGIADAFNKGIQNASGAIIHLLNSGDCYTDTNVLKDVTNFFSKNNVGWISGKLKTVRSNYWVTVGKPFDKKKLYRGMRSVSHPTWFVKKTVYDKIGWYRSDFKIAMDYDMMCRIVNESYKYFDREITVFDPTGISSNKYIESLIETRKVYESYFGFSIMLVLWQIRLKLLYRLMHSPLGNVLYNIKRKLKLENA